ncbi:hypothetical protein IRZ71_12220 [Flavobacterium sp. ANB]|uniref:hypothetical protein n=1 Tax=unclassified Flavobacterium TaxID=196869 RepID=UPI0012B7FCA5|nr:MULTISPECIES: hypothetical protein [unclassified Flavobacterium]MBF4517119.1 hypothetical protein [Flavobacterium sp. ANB]MTD71856.1 hypothetical protein [Flavobacterium sp. LC2016-13]
MKKLLLFFLLLSKSILLSQTVLNSYPLYLNDPIENSQALNVEDTKTHDVYVFATDSKRINILKYNKSLFLTNQFTDSISNTQNKSLMGYSISEDGNPTLYWGSDYLKNIKIIKYYLETKTSKTLNFDFPQNNESILTTFQKNNNFYIVAKEKNEQHILLYEFKNGKCEIKMFDLSGFPFQNEKGQTFTFSSLIRYYPIEKMESNDFNPLDKTTSINKMYVLEDRIILTFDYNSKKTQVFDLNLETTAVTEKNFDQPVTKKASQNSNSFYSENQLFQIKTNNDEFLFDIKDFDSGKTLKSVSVSKNDTIRFKNSPFLLQIGDNKPQELKTTSKYLKQLSGLSVGVSVFKSKGNNFITFGGYLEYVAFSIDYGQNDFFNDGNQSQFSRTKRVFFDAALSPDFEFVKQQSEPLAIDNISYFLSITKNVSVQNILKLKNYSILSYYDIASKQFIMRKFTDGFIREDNGNPIMNKAQFSKPFRFDKS